MKFHTLKKAVFFLLISTLVSACGKRGETWDDRCTKEFVDDFSEVNLKAYYAASRDDLLEARSMAIQLKKKYRGVDCKAEIVSISSNQRRRGRINVNEKMDKLIEEIDDVLLGY